MFAPFPLKVAWSGISLIGSLQLNLITLGEASVMSMSCCVLYMQYINVLFICVLVLGSVGGSVSSAGFGHLGLG